MQNRLGGPARSTEVPPGTDSKSTSSGTLWQRTSLRWVQLPQSCPTPPQGNPQQVLSPEQDQPQAESQSGLRSLEPPSMIKATFKTKAPQ